MEQTPVSEQKLKLAQKLVEIRKSVQYVKKETKGNDGKYASGAQVLGALKIKMDELGVLLEPHVLNKEILHYEQKTKNGSRAMVQVMADMEMVWVDSESGEERKVPFACFGAQNNISKAFGTALTYSERYFMLKYFNIPTDDLDPEAFQRKAENTITKPQEPKKKLADYTTPMMESDTVTDHNKWLKANWPKASADLSKADMGKLLKECDQWLTTLEKKAANGKPQVIKCPNAGHDILLTDCKASVDCNVTCKPYQDAIK